jgi:hypothetical protein
LITQMSSVPFENAIRPASEDTSTAPDAAGDGAELGGEPADSRVDGEAVEACDPAPAFPPDVHPTSTTIAAAASRSITAAPDTSVPPAVHRDGPLPQYGPADSSLQRRSFQAAARAGD